MNSPEKLASEYVESWARIQDLDMDWERTDAMTKRLIVSIFTDLLIRGVLVEGPSLVDKS